MLVSTLAFAGPRDEPQRDIARAHLRAARAARTPFWRRELRLFPRRTKNAAVVRAAVEESATATPEPAEPKVPWYKRELGPTKKSKTAKQQAKVEKELARAEKKRAKVEKQSKAGAPVETPTVDDQPGAEPKVQWYKREIGRKKREEPVEVPEEPRHEDPDEPTAVERVIAATEPAPSAADAWSAFFGDAVVTDNAPKSDQVDPAGDALVDSGSGWSADDGWPAADPDAAHTTHEAAVVDDVFEPVGAEPKAPWYEREFGPSKASKAAKRDAKAAAKQQAKEDKLRAKAQRKQAEVEAGEAKAAAKQQAKEDELRAKAEKKQAEVDAREAKAAAKQQAKEDELRAKAEKKQAEADAREAKAAAKLQAKEDKLRAKAEKKQAEVPWYKREIGRKKREEPVAVMEEPRVEEPGESTAVERIIAATSPSAGPDAAQPADPAPDVVGAWPVEDDPAAQQADELEVADVLPDAVGAETKVPWHKRELGPSKAARAAKRDAKQQAKDDKTRAKAEKKQAEIDAREARAAAKRQAKEDKARAKAEKKQSSVPWHKRELGRKKTNDADAEAPAKAKAPKSDVPWYKRELGRPKRSPQVREPRKSHARRGGGRKQRIVGLKIGGSQLAAARITNNGSAELVQLARADLDRGVVVGGELRDPEALTTALKKFFRDNKLPRQGVRLGIGSNRIGVRVFDIAGVEDRALLDNAVRFKAQEFLPIPLGQAVLDYHVVGESVDDEGQPVHRVLVAFAYRELVDRYLEACRRAGIRLSGIDLEAFALLRALGAPEPTDAPRRDAAVIAVAIGHDRSTLAVSDGRICEFTRILEWGGFQLDVAVSRVLDVTPSEAEAVKRQVDLTVSEGVIGDLTLERSQEVRDAVRRQVELLARELVSSLQFYQSQSGSLGVGEIVVTGGTAQLRGLDAELQRLIGVKVRLGDPFARVKVGRRIKAAEQLPSLAVAIGLGIED